ncbi:MAG TPA: hypothetical protein VF743_05240 [Acidimicrobiales bacterium]
MFNHESIVRVLVEDRQRDIRARTGPLPTSPALVRRWRRARRPSG